MVRTSKGAASPPERLILDSGALSAFAEGDTRAAAWIEKAISQGVPVLIPSVVVAESLTGRGPRDAKVNRALTAIGSVTTLDETTARIAGGVRARARSSATVDAIVVAEAMAAGGGAVLTGDPIDLEKLAAPCESVHVVPLHR